MKTKSLCLNLLLVLMLWGGVLNAQTTYNARYTAGVEVAAGGDYFLYNIGADMFLTEGMNWGTHATVDHAGRVLTFTSLGDNKYNIYSQSYSVNNNADAKNGYVFVNDGIWMDAANDSKTDWLFVPVSVDGYANAYTIRCSDTQYMHYNPAEAKVNAGESTHDKYSYWIIIPKSQREAKRDYTYYLQNTDFNRPWQRFVWNNTSEDGGSFNPAGGNARNYCAEYFNKTNYDISQTVAQTVPNGTYSLWCQGFYRAGDYTNGNSTEQNALLYLNSNTVPLMNAISGGADVAGNGYTVSSGGQYIPNTMTDASTVFSAGGYAANSVKTDVTDGKITVGLKKTTYITNDWTIFDNFYLEYSGFPATEAYYLYNPMTEKFLSRGSSWGTRAVVDEYGLPFTMDDAGDGTYYLHFIDNGGYLCDEAWLYTDGGTDRYTKFAVTNAAADGYQGYYLENQKLEENNRLYVYMKDGNEKYCVAGNAIMGDNVSDYAQTVWQFKTQAERDVILAQKTQAGKIAVGKAANLDITSGASLATALKALFTEEDMTSRIRSASLENGYEGWTYTPDEHRTALNNGGRTDLGIECYQGAGMLTQTVTGLPDGLYKVTVSAFYRDGKNEDRNANEHTDGYKRMSTAYLMANGQQTQIATWASDATAKDAPNGMEAAKKLFDEGKYLNEVYAYVGKDGRLDLTLGFPSYIKPYGWFMADNVTLTYYKPLSGYKNVTPDDQNLSFETGDLTNWSIPIDEDDKAHRGSDTQVTNEAYYNMSNKDGDYLFNTWTETDSYWELQLRHNGVELEAGTYKLTGVLCGYNTGYVYMKALDDSGNVLGQTVYHPLGYDEKPYGADVGSPQSLYFTLTETATVHIFVSNKCLSSPGQSFFKCDNFRFYKLEGTVDMTGLLPNPSFEYADGNGAKERARTISDLGGEGTIPGTGDTEKLYGWALPTMQGYVTASGNPSHNRIALGTAESLDVFSAYPADNLEGLPAPVDGEIYYYNGQNMRNTGGEQTYTLSTQTLSVLPAGFYKLTLRYKGVGAYQSGWPKTGDSNIALKVKIGDTELGTATSAPFDYYDRNEGNDRATRNAYLATRPWQTLQVQFFVETPGVASIDILEKFCQAYSTDIILDDLRLEAMAIPTPPVHRATGTIPSGTKAYYLMNAATGQFLSAGNKYGTHASLDSHGLPFDVRYGGSGGVGIAQYDLSSPVYFNATSHYLSGTGNYVDAAQVTTGDADKLTYYHITYQGNGRYTLKHTSGEKYLTACPQSIDVANADYPVTSLVDLSGTSATSLANQWYLISKADRELNLLEETTDGDATFYIPNASFSRNQDTEYNKNVWASTGTNISMIYGHQFYNSSTNVAQAYHTPFLVTKTVTVPNGTYRFRAQGFYRQDGADGENLPVVFARTSDGTEQTTTLPERTGTENTMLQAAQSFVVGKYYTDWNTIEVTDNILTVGVRLEWNAELWSIWDNYELQLISHNEGTGNVDDIDAVITEMTDNPGFLQGQYAPYVTTAAKAIRDVVDTDFPYSYDKVAGALPMLFPANSEEVNAIYRHDFSDYRSFHAVKNSRAVAIGWSLNNADNSGVLGLWRTEPTKENTVNVGLGDLDSKKALLIKASQEDTYGKTAGYEMPLFGGVQYQIAFRYGGWGNNSGTIALSVKDADGNELYTGGSISVTKRVENATGNWTEWKGTFATTASGNHTLTLTPTADVAIGDFSLYMDQPAVESNTYYIYNVATGQYIDAGSWWGTRAILDEAGLDIQMEAVSGGYTFDTNIVKRDKYRNKTDNHYLATGWDDVNNLYTTYCDDAKATWQLIPTGKGAYYLRDGNGYLSANGENAPLVTSPLPNGDATCWMLKTYKDRVDEMKEMEADGKTTIPATFLIDDAHIGRFNERWNNWTTWSESAGVDAVRYYGWYAVNGDGEYEGDGEKMQNRRGGFVENYIVENWHRKPNVYQTLSGRGDVTLPCGVYTLTAQGFDGENGTTSYLYIKDEDNAAYAETRAPFSKKTDLTSDDFSGGFNNGVISKWFAADASRGLITAKVRIFGDTTQDGNPAKFTVGVQNTGTNQWTVFDNFRLTYRPFVKDDLKAEEVNTANAHKQYNIGDSAFQIKNTETHYVALDNASTTAASLSNASTNVQIASAIVGLLKADDEYMRLAQVNLPTTRYTLENISTGYDPRVDNKETGAATQGKVLTVKGAKDAEAGAVEMGWTEKVGSIYPQAFIFEQDNSVVNGFTLSYIDGSGSRRYLCTGKMHGGSADEQIRTSTSSSDALTFRIIPQTTTDKIWYLVNTAVNPKAGNVADGRLGANGQYDRGFYTANQFCNLTFSNPKNVTDGLPTVELSISKKYKLTTLMLPFDASIPSEATAYTIGTINNGEVELMKEDGKLIAGRPYIVKAPDGIEATLQNYGQGYTDELLTEGAMTGTYQTAGSTIKYEAGVNKYILSVKTYDGEEVVAFYRITKDRALPANRAYFTPSLISTDSSTSFIFNFDEDDETAVEEQLPMEAEVEAIYDLRGMRQSRMQRGVNILRMTDGTTRKVMVK